jgi:hypothetical protein
MSCTSPRHAPVSSPRLSISCEPLEIAAHLSLDDPRRSPRHSRCRTRPDVHLDVDPRLIVRRSSDDAVVLDLAADRLPGDLLVRPLLRNLGRPLTDLAPNLGDPLHVPVVELLDGLDPFHELREVLELRPLVVRLLNRNPDVD